MDEKRRASASYDFLWLSLALLPLLFISLLLPLTPHDYWWYLRLGQDTIALRGVPRYEMYSFTHMGQPIINQPWLAAVIFWLAYARGRLTLTFLLRYLSIGSAYGLLWVWMRRIGAAPRLAALLTILAGLAGSNNWSFRPQMFCFALFVLMMMLLWEWQYKNSRALWLLPLISCLWANLHDSFLLVYILIGASFIFGRGDRKQLFVIGGIAFLATLITPLGLELTKSLFQFPISLQLSAEWFPPSNQGWQMNLFFAWLLAFVPLAALSSKRLSLLEWAWFLGFSWLALSGLRYVVWVLFLFAAWTAYLLAGLDIQWLKFPINTNRASLHYILGIAFLLLPITALPGLRERWGMIHPPAISPDTPISATEWLAQHPKLPGPLWSDLSFSSYLIYTLPSRPVEIDTRFEMLYTAEEYQLFSEVASASPNWQTLLDRGNINLLMISTQSEPNLLQAVAGSDQWCRQYRDDVAAVFSRKQPGQACP